MKYVCICEQWSRWKLWASLAHTSLEGCLPSMLDRWSRKQEVAIQRTCNYVLLWVCPSVIVLLSKLPCVWQLTFKCTSLQALLASFGSLFLCAFSKEINGNHSVAHQEQGWYKSCTCTAACISEQWSRWKLWEKLAHIVEVVCPQFWNQPSSKPQKSKVAIQSTCS